MTTSRGPLPKDNHRHRIKKPDLGLSQIEAKAPRAPKELTGEARAEWRRIVPELEAVGLLANVDRGVLIRYCVAWQEWMRANHQAQREPLIIVDKDGSRRRNPILLARAQAEKEVDDLARLLGLTPVSRLRAGVKHVRPSGAKVTQEERDAGIPSIDERRRRMMQS